MTSKKTRKQLQPEDFLDRIQYQDSVEVIGTAIHVLGNRANSIMSAADVLKLYLLENEELELSRDKLERMLDIILNNTEEVANVLKALGQYQNEQFDK